MIPTVTNASNEYQKAWNQILIFESSLCWESVYLGPATMLLMLQDTPGELLIQDMRTSEPTSHDSGKSYAIRGYGIHLRSRLLRKDISAFLDSL